ncbi:MAG: glycosyltransferase family 2 protein, partial [Acidimicrobiales bacterium]
MRLGLPRVDEPLVSVVMLAYGARDWVEAALRALVANTPPVYEAVILDNASPDGTGDWLAANVEGATLVRNPVNVGFGPGANQAVLSARGRHVCLLNSDALVEPGWLEPLVADLEGIPGCGAVIPRFLNLDWTLQEAGAVVGADGQTMAMGYGDDPDRPWHRFPRFVDYGSGACLLSRRSTFLAAGGFDPCYGLGYYEDVDLCFRLRRDGMRIAYEPRSVVRHVRGASSATTSVLRLREGNAELFRRRWGQALRHRPPLTELQSRPERVVAARDVEAPDRVLVMGARLPRSMDDRAARLVVEMATVAGEARITLVGLDDEGPAEEVSALLDAGIEVIWGINDWDDWMSRCRWHYPVAVVTDPLAGERAAALLSEYQPQALVAIDVD